MKLLDLFVKKKPYELLSLLYSLEITYPSFLSRSINCSFAHTVDLLRLFEKLGLVEIQKSSLKITEKGRRTFEILKKLENLEEDEEASVKFIRRTIERIRVEKSEEVRERLKGYIRREIKRVKDESLRRWIERELNS
jgi:predicted transcriptional regulator